MVTSYVEEQYNYIRNAHPNNFNSAIAVELMITGYL